MTSPQETRILHFTRVEHLPDIAKFGLLSDKEASRRGLVTVEIGNRKIKARRAIRQVPVQPGGVVSDYVPFYFAPRSPMMYAIHAGNVPTYQQGCETLVYLATTVEQLTAMGMTLVLTDRNAVLEVTEFWSMANGEPEEGFIDWSLMHKKYWASTQDSPDRSERRMAECLVRDLVPYAAFSEVVTKTEGMKQRAVSLLGASGADVRVSVRPSWYF